jgi:hypothetical protein
VRNKEILKNLEKTHLRIKDYFVQNKIPPTILEDMTSISKLERILRVKEVPFTSFKDLVEKDQKNSDATVYNFAAGFFIFWVGLHLLH